MKWEFDLPYPEGTGPIWEVKNEASMSFIAELEELFRRMTPRQVQAWLDGFERYEAAGAPYGNTAADALRWLEDQPGGFPDPEEEAA